MSNNFKKLVLGLFLATACLPLAAQTYSFQAFSYPYFNSPDTYALGINNRGAVVGYMFYHGPCFTGQLTRGFKRDANGVFGKPIDDPNSHNGLCYAVATGINDSGVITGYYYNQHPPNGYSGFLIIQGVFTDYHLPGSVFTEVLGINNKGDLVGVAGTHILHPFVSINGVISHFTYPGASRTLSYGIAADDTIVGIHAKHGNVSGFLRGPGGQFESLRIPGATATYVYGINNASHSIVGTYSTPTLGHGFVYDYTTDVITTVDYPDPNATDTVVTGINSHGVIVGYVRSQDAQKQALPVYSFIGTPQ
jgi:hypothetical protein